MTFRATLRRWHMWLGWLVGVPVLFWTVSGFVMVARPNDEVRGVALLREPALKLTIPKLKFESSSVVKGAWRVTSPPMNPAPRVTAVNSIFAANA